jgi:hypothetical protein
MRNARPFLSSSLSLIAASSVLALAACGGGSGSASIGGTVTGLRNGLTLVMQNNASDNFSITGNGATSFTFSFATALSAGNSYNVTVLTQPLGQTCTIANGSGTVDSSGDSIGSVAVTCATTSSVVGTVSGLLPGVAVTLSSNGTSLPIAVNGNFSFPGILTTGSTYTVTVTQQPAGQTCTIANATGIVVANTPSVVTVTCN